MNRIQIDGTGYQVLAVGSLTDVVLTTNSIFFIKDYSSLFSMNYDGSNLTPIYPSVNWFDCRLAANGAKVLLTSFHSDSPLGANNLYIMNSDGSNLQQLTLAMAEFSLAQISPSLDEILFERKSGIATANVDGTNLQYIRTSTDSSDALFPCYIDDNHILYCESIHSDGSISVRLFDKSNHVDKLIVSHSQIGFPYSGKILQGDSLLCVERCSIKILESANEKIVNVAQGCSATFSVDGMKIVYTDGSRIYIQNTDGTNIQFVYSEQDQSKTVVLPQLSPDGKFIIFQTLYSIPMN
jgi:hypothetical protein